MSVGAEHTCALFEHGELKCWGNMGAYHFEIATPGAYRVELLRTGGAVDANIVKRRLGFARAFGNLPGALVACNADQVGNLGQA